MESKSGEQSYLSARTEAEALAEFMETHADVVDQMRVMLELMASRGLPISLVASMLIGGAVGGLIEGGIPADEIRRFATEVVDDSIRNLQQRPRA
jgi:hypothetical protein